MTRQRLARVLIGLAGLGIVGVAAAYVLTVPPKPVGLASPSPSSSAFVVDDSTPNGVWLATTTPGAFVGYWVHEKLGLDFIDWPNEAVGRTEAVSGRLDIRDGVLQVAEIEADLRRLRSDQSDRDTNVGNNALLVAQFPTARFRLTEPVPRRPADAGRPRSSCSFTAAEFCRSPMPRTPGRRSWRRPPLPVVLR